MRNWLPSGSASTDNSEPSGNEWRATIVAPRPIRVSTAAGLSTRQVEVGGVLPLRPPVDLLESEARHAPVLVRDVAEAVVRVSSVNWNGSKSTSPSQARLSPR